MWGTFVAIVYELTLFAAVGFLIGGLDDLLVDMIWIGRTLWRRVAVYTRHARASAATLAPARRPGRIAVFIPAWDEGPVIGAMLDHACCAWTTANITIYVGIYPNDPATASAVAAIGDRRIRPVVGPLPGPTTKADCLNGLWAAMEADEKRTKNPFKAIVLHDAEDVVHADEIALFDSLIDRFAFVQLPVVPLIDRRSRWIGGHYNDEFAEAHGKTIVVREAVGAAIPAAGVGCAFDRHILGRIAAARGGAPFDADSLTEDYELGLRLAEIDARDVFVRLASGSSGPIVATRAHFPATLSTAVRQKARWIAGIALSGWDRLGWRGGIAECWMRLHDRRGPLGAIVLTAAYAALVLNAGIVLSAFFTGWTIPAPSPLLAQLLSVSSFLLLWRLAVRAFFVTRTYGWREGFRSVPRVIVGNVVALMAAWRAIALYLRMRRDGVVRWDKTTHKFPDQLPTG